MIRRFLAATAVAATVLGATAAQADFKPLEGDPDEIVFGIISTESTSNLKRQWLPLLEDMEKALGKKVNAFFAPDYAGIIEGMRFGKVHVAWHGNKSAMGAVDMAGGEVFAQQTKADGTIGYYSHVITHVDNKDLNSLEDLLKCDKSLDFGIGDPNSTSGFLVPTFYVFAKNNVDPKNCFKTLRSANHETNLMATAHKQVHAAANNSEQIARSQANAPDAAKNIKVIWTSPLIPADPMVYRKDLSRDLKARIQAFFLGYGRMGDVERAKQVLAELNDGMGPFLASSNAQLYPIRELELYKNRLKIESDERLSASDKAQKLAEIDSELAKISVLAASM